LSSTVIFDLETIRLAADMADDGRPIGWAPERLHLMGISWGCMWSTATGEVEHFDEYTFSRLAQALERAALVVSFNGIKFDVPLLSGYLKRELTIPRHCDLLAIIYQSCGKRYSLDDIAAANLGYGKTGYGGHAPELFRSGRIADLATYCARDVGLTRDLFFLAVARGWLYAPDSSRILTPVLTGLRSVA